MFQRLVKRLEFYGKDYDVNIISLCDNREMSIGEKRNKLLQSAKSKYVMFVDDDDHIHLNALDWIFNALKHDPDCVELKGILTTNRVNPKLFIHSIEYNSYFEDNGIYYRPPNHLNPIRREIAQQFKFPENNFGEDTDWAMQIARSGKLKSEGKVPDAWYYYNWVKGISTTFN